MGISQRLKTARKDHPCRYETPLTDYRTCSGASIYAVKLHPISLSLSAQSLSAACESQAQGQTPVGPV